MDRILEYSFISFGFGFIILILGLITNIEAIKIVGLIGLMPLILSWVFIIVFGIGAYSYDFLDRKLPYFRGKEIILVIVAILIMAFVILLASDGGGYDGPCLDYGRYPRC